MSWLSKVDPDDYADAAAEAVKHAGGTARQADRARRDARADATKTVRRELGSRLRRN